jgi:uncharacterized protein YodC (DUF2158 family)
MGDVWERVMDAASLEKTRTDKDFKTGDVVTLNSGGNAMTVRKIADNGDIVVNYFPSNAAEMVYASFPSEMLVKATAESAAPKPEPQS